MRLNICRIVINNVSFLGRIRARPLKIGGKSVPELLRILKVVPREKINVVSRPLNLAVTATKPITYEILGYRLLSLWESFGINSLILTDEPGINELAKKWAIEFDVFYQIIRIHWSKDGNSAHRIRYFKLLNKVDFVLAFDEQSMLFKIAQLKRVPIILVERNIRIKSEIIEQLY